MKHAVKTVLSLGLTTGLILSALSACSDKAPASVQISDSTTAVTTILTSANTTATIPPVTEPSTDHTAELSNNTYAIAGMQLLDETIKQYYSDRSHTVKTSLTDSNTAFLWPTTAFVEALAESYVLYPENDMVKNCYIDMLDNGFDRFKVTNASLNTPSGSYSDITYYNAANGGEGAYFYDDNAWVCIRYLTAYEQFGKPDYLARAEEILDFLWTGWDDFQGGGIYWDRTYSGNKGGCTNAPAAISYLWAYQLTDNPLYLERGKLLYDWMNEHLRDANGLYYAEVYHPWQPCYDQGTMIYASCLLYTITGDRHYYDMANATAESVVAHMFTVEDNGESQTVSMRRNPIFKSWGVGWLTRGIIRFISIEPHQSVFMTNLKQVVDQTLTTKDANGQYDPFFCAPGNDFWTEDYFDSEVIQPSGIVIVLQLVAYYDVYLINQ